MQRFYENYVNVLNFESAAYTMSGIKIIMMSSKCIR